MSTTLLEMCNRTNHDATTVMVYNERWNMILCIVRLEIGPGGHEIFGIRDQAANTNPNSSGSNKGPHEMMRLEEMMQEIPLEDMEGRCVVVSGNVFQRP
jgi:hypothetical protein